jgi:hypothetical protein
MLGHRTELGRSRGVPGSQAGRVTELAECLDACVAALAGVGWQALVLRQAGADTDARLDASLEGRRVDDDSVLPAFRS